MLSTLESLQNFQYRAETETHWRDFLNTFRVYSITSDLPAEFLQEFSRVYSRKVYVLNTLLGREELLLFLPVLDAVLDGHTAPGDSLQKPPTFIGSLYLLTQRPVLGLRELLLHVLRCSLGRHSAVIQHDHVLREKCSENCREERCPTWA